MFDPESVDIALGVAPQMQTRLADSLTDAWQARENIAQNRFDVEEAQAAVKAANEALKAVTDKGRQLSRDKQHADTVTERIGDRLAAEVLLTPDLDEVSKVLFSIIYHDGRNAGQVDEVNNPYTNAIKTGGRALATIASRLQPDEPILYFDRGEPVVSVAGKNPLIAELPPTHYTRKTLDETIPGDYLSFSLGTIYLDMPDAVIAKPESQRLVAVDNWKEPNRVTLISPMYEEGLERLENAATNNRWLIIGNEAIKGYMELGLDGEGGSTREHLHLPVATAMTAAGIEIPFEITTSVKEETKKTLTNLVAFIASGGEQETTNEKRHGLVEDLIVAVDKNPLHQLSTVIDQRSIRHMAATIGLTKQKLEASVQELLGAKINDDTTSLKDLSKGLTSRAQLQEIVNQIFRS